MRRTILVALTLVTACTGEKETALQAELAALDLQLVSLDARASELEAKRARLAAALPTYEATARAATAEVVRLGWAAVALQGEPLPPAYAMHQAIVGPDKDLSGPASTFLRPMFACTTGDEEAEEDDDGEDGFDGDSCTPVEPEDQCAGVSARIKADFPWSCAAVTGSRLPAVACLAQRSPALAGEPTFIGSTVVRVAFLHQGRLIAADYPGPGRDLYSPPNSAELARCEEDTQAARCVFRCDGQFGKLSPPVGCMEEGEHDDGEDEEGEGEGEDENLAVAEARRRAEEAAWEAEQAQQEVRYQECIAGCEGNAGSEDSSEEEDPVEPQSGAYESSPAEGVFIVRQAPTTRTDGGTARGALVLRAPVIDQALAGALDAEAASAQVNALELELLIDDLATARTREGTLLYGLGMEDEPLGLHVVGARATTLSSAEVCQHAGALARADVVRACQALAASPPGSAAGVDGGGQ